jgi:SERRATE/Ars2, N-terminal domain
MATDYRDPAAERPRDSWTDRNDRDTSPSYRRDSDDRPRRIIILHLNLIVGHDSYRRRHSDRASFTKNLDPYTLDHIVPFTYFCEWYKQANARTLSKGSEISKDELQESFIKYRDDLLARTAKDFVKDHSAEAWFREKYDPTLGPPTRNKLIEYRKWLYQSFMKDLDEGKFDDLALDGAAGTELSKLTNA